MHQSTTCRPSISISISISTIILFLWSVTSTTTAFLSFRVNQSCFTAPHSSKHFAITGELKTVLKKPSKTLSSIFEVDAPTLNSGDLAVRSMQLRKANASAIYCQDLKVTAELVKEQSSAMGNFPGPLPIIYDGESSIEEVLAAGASAFVVRGDVTGVSHFENVIYRVASADDVNSIVSSNENANAFFLKASEDSVDDILDAVPDGSIVVASLKSMQTENSEIELAKALKAKGVSSILMEKAIVGDNEDLEYTSFVVSGLTRKKSSTFNMTGLTGSTNGHFGGVATNTSQSWRRQKTEAFLLSSKRKYT